MSTILLLLVGILIGRAISDFEIKRILGCEKHLYMTRTILLRTRWGKLMINYFHRSDEDRALHDHPWTFYSLILWRGYLEHTRGGGSANSSAAHHQTKAVVDSPRGTHRRKAGLHARMDRAQGARVGLSHRRGMEGLANFWPRTLQRLRRKYDLPTMPT